MVLIRCSVKQCGRPKLALHKRPGAVGVRAYSGRREIVVVVVMKSRRGGLRRVFMEKAGAPPGREEP